MPDFHSSNLLAACLGIALSASCGFRVFLPLLAGSIGAHYQLFPVPEAMQWLGSWACMLSFSVAAIIEMAAYYVPFLDNALDFIGAPVAMIAGTLLASSIIPIFSNEPAVRWILALVAGGGAAGTLHLGNGLIRLFSSKVSVGVGNPVIATGENVAAIGASTASFFIPFIVAIIMSLLILASVILAAKKLFSRPRKY